MRSDLRRTRTLAQRRGLCPVHLRRLYCLGCSYAGEWTGTDEQLEELAALMRRNQPYYAHIRPQGRCPCGGDRYCETCWNAASARVRLPDDLYTAEEMARGHALLELLHVTDGASPQPSIPRQERNP